MTRINTCPASDLTDQHLMAEHRELPRVFSLARAALERGNVAGPEQYTLGSGHVRFFFARTRWLAERHAALTAELLNRGFRLTERPPLEPIPGLDGDWTPTDADHAVSLARLRERLAERPGWYRHRGRVVEADFYAGCA